MKDPRVAVVNGGAGGIGQATVARFGREGYVVVILDRDESACHAAVAEGAKR